jgi:signal transduction histidine kinase
MINPEKMKPTKHQDPPRSTSSPRDRIKIFLLLASIAFTALAGYAQEKNVIQVKTFDQQLQPYRNIELSINEKAYISMGAKGVAFIELRDNELPVKSVKIKNEQLEAASWNYSKGTLEITIRKKSYQVHRLLVRDQNNTPVGNVNVSFNGKKLFTATTSADGRIEMPLALDDKITSDKQFAIAGYNVINLQASESDNILTVDLIKNEIAAEPPRVEKTIQAPKYFQGFDLSKLDSIQSLTVFYAIFKNLDIKEMSPDVQQRIDAKFNELVRQLEQSGTKNEVAFTGRISDSSFVSDDIRNLLEQARVENQTLDIHRSDFDEKIKLINDKLASGISNLSGETRAILLSDLTLLERLLVANESRFYKNQSDYRQLINSLKEKFFNFEDLENKLSLSERQRLEEQRIFRQRLFAILSLALIFAVLIVLLIYFGNKLRKQKKELSNANAEIKHINENLEGLVTKRTALLVEAHRELDTFLYRASHDLRSPICSIIGLCNIATHIAQNESKELFEKAGQTASGMDKMLKKLRIISEIHNPTNFSSIDLLSLAEDIKSKFNDVILEHSIKFEIDCSEGLTFQSYPVLLKAILFNMIENAVFYSVLEKKHTPEVQLSIKEESENLKIIVYDNGVGIDDAIRQRLFDMFFKGNEYSKGNGLGLYVVQKSANALSGSISIESDVGSYSKFTIRLPMKNTENANNLIFIHHEELQEA